MQIVNGSARQARGVAQVLASLLILVFPAASLSTPRAGNTLIITATALAVLLLLRREAWASLCHVWHRPGTRLFCLAMAAPITSILISEAYHGEIVASTLDSPSRFLMAIPIFLALRTRQVRLAPWTDLTFALGGLGAALVIVFAPFDWGSGRLGSNFLNPIHFGDIATLLFVLSLLSINWIRRDNVWVKALKILGALFAAYASIKGGSRGGWVALPVIAVMLIAVGMHRHSWKLKLAAALASVVIIAIPTVLAPVVLTRFDQIGSDLKAMKQGDDDSSIGVRLKLYQASVQLFTQNPVFGLGAFGYKRSMPELSAEGALTPHAAELGRGETHNQIFAYAVDYGILGLLASMGLYVVPWLLLWRRRYLPNPTQHRTVLMALVYVLGFFIFGLTVDTFTLKITTSVYAAMVAALTGMALDDDTSHRVS